MTVSPQALCPALSGTARSCVARPARQDVERERSRTRVSRSRSLPLLVIVALGVIRRGLGFGFTKPTTDMLYSVVSPEAKYKAKNFIETTVYRGWDVVASFGVRAMGAIGLSGVALVCVPVAFIWMLIARWIGGAYGRRDAAAPKMVTS